MYSECIYGAMTFFYHRIDCTKVVGLITFGLIHVDGYSAGDVCTRGCPWGTISS